MMRNFLALFLLTMLPASALAQPPPPGVGPGGEPWGTTAPACSGGGDVIAYDGSSYDATAAVCVDPAAPANSLCVEATTGDIGIGTCSPDEEVEVEGEDDVFFRSTCTDVNCDAGIEFVNDVRTLSIRVSGSGDLMRFQSGSSSMLVLNDGAPNNSWYQDADGQMGIATISPDANVHVVGTFGVEPVDTAGAFTGGMYWDGSGLGIGTVSPAANLHVKWADASLVFEPATAGDTAAWLGLVEDGAGDDNDTFRLGLGATPGTGAEFVMEADGEFAMGTVSSSGDTLRVHDDGTEVQLRLTNGNGHQYQLLVGSTGIFSLSDLSAGTVPFRVSNNAPSDSFRVAGDGKVGFNTATPDFQGHIVGRLCVEPSDGAGTCGGFAVESNGYPQMLSTDSPPACAAGTKGVFYFDDSEGHPCTCDGTNYVDGVGTTCT